MEGNLNMVPGGGSFGVIDLQQQSMRYNHHQAQPPQQQPLHAVMDTDPRQGPVLHPSIHDVFPPLSMGTMQDWDRSVSLAEYNKTERVRNVASDDDEICLMEDASNCQGGGGEGAKGSLWHRVKWSDQMVKLLITAVSYTGQDVSSGYGGGGGGGGRGRMKFALMLKKGKWKSISKVMAERGFYVSPQQCEDKFNDLNKRYKRLNDILGRGTSCQVVEKPELLDLMDHLSEKSKEDVRKILSSKHLFYEEMCSYHNGNRLHLPHDPALQRSLQLALESREISETSDGRMKSNDDYDENDHAGESDDCDEFEECHTARGNSHAICGAMSGKSAKRAKQDLSREEFSFGNALEASKTNQLSSQNVQIDMNQAYPEGSKSAWYQSQMIQSQTLKLEEQRTKIQMEMLELEKQRLKWQKFSKKKDRELEKMRLENERMKLENEGMALELKRRQMGLKGV
ncbi:unnamed protein product [Rhodiola kirilowii]